MFLNYLKNNSELMKLLKYLIDIHLIDVIVWSGCPTGWCLVCGRCLYLNNELTFHDDSLSLCKSKGGNLVMPKTLEFFEDIMGWEYVTRKP